VISEVEVGIKQDEISSKNDNKNQLSQIKLERSIEQTPFQSQSPED
jgi:hypothetical protein